MNSVRHRSISTGTSAVIEQLRLFDFGVDLARLRSQAQTLIAAGTRAANTERAYASDWRQFLRWCEAAGRPALPAAEETICFYLADLASRVKVATVAHHAFAIRRRHLAQGFDTPIGRDALALLAGLRRSRGSEQRPKAALSPEQLRAIAGRLDRNTCLGARNAAVLLFGFACGLRRADLVALNLEDLEFTSLGVVVHVGRRLREKNDQAGRGREVAVFYGHARETCRILALDAWLEHRSRSPGPVFCRCDRGAVGDRVRLGAASVAMIVRNAVEAIGLDPAAYGAHSLRAGMITACAAAGASDSSIMQRSGHGSVEMIKRYRRHADLFYANPLAGVL